MQKTPEGSETLLYEKNRENMGVRAGAPLCKDLLQVKVTYLSRPIRLLLAKANVTYDLFNVSRKGVIAASSSEIVL